MDELNRLYGIYDTETNVYLMTFNCNPEKRVDDVLYDFVRLYDDDDDLCFDEESLQLRWLGYYDDSLDIPYILNSVSQIVCEYKKED